MNQIAERLRDVLEDTILFLSEAQKDVIKAGLKKLSAYEDTGLEPEEIKALIPPPNPPLTLDELREMGGEPYWHVGLQKDSPPPHWNILDPLYARHIEDYGYGKRWLAYRRKPEEGLKCRC